MALYEYKCKECEGTITVSRSISDPETAVFCASCTLPLSRVYSSVGVTFNGSGFYSTDK
jgi:putative FmdB family regulatory protein